MQRLFLTLYIAFLSFPALAQIRDFSVGKDAYEPPSPQVYTLSRYGSESVDTYTGAMRYQIPIFNYSDSEFHLEASLNYGFSGFIPSVSSGVLGYGWAMSIGGVITREIRGVADEHKAIDNADDCNGYYHLKNDGLEENDDIVSVYSGLLKGGATTLDKSIPAYLYGHRPSYMYVDDRWVESSPGDSKIYETTPDIFHFSVNGRQGDFTITAHSGKASAYMCDGAFADYDITFYPSAQDNQPWNSKIIIVDKAQGLTYIFGGGKKYCDYVDYNLPSVEKSIQITAWHLKEVIAPSGRVMEFNYAYPQVQCIEYSKAQNYYSYGDVQQGNYSGHISYYNAGIQNNYCYVINRQLKDVKINGRYIFLCNYEPVTHTESDIIRAPHESGNLYQLRLKDFIVYNNISLIVENLSFEHSYSLSGPGGSRMFLSSVKSKRNGIYSFEYNKEYEFPSLSSTSVDHWSYWNGKEVPKGYIPLSTIGDQDTSLYNITGILKDANYNYAQRGALTKIIYPTGAFAQIEYEPHTIEKRWNRSLLNPYGLLEICPNGFKIGGVRVKSFSLKDEEKEVNRYDYIYSKGILNYMPRYVFAQTFYTEGISLSDFSHKGIVVSYDAASTYLRRDPIVSYEKVSLLYKDGSKKENLFYSYNDFPDAFTFVLGDYSQTYEIACDPDIVGHSINQQALQRAADLISSPSVDYSYIRGKLKSEREYDSNGLLRLQKDYDYNVVDGISVDIFSNLYLAFRKQKLFHVYPQLKSIKSTEYFLSGQNHSVEKHYSYNSKGRITLEEIKGIDQSRRNYYRYSEDVASNQSSYWVGAIKDKVSTVVKDSKEYLSSSISFIYPNSCRDDNYPNPQVATLYDYHFETPYLISSQNDIFNAGRESIFSVKHFTYDSLYYRPIRIEARHFDLKLKWDRYGKNIEERNLDGYVVKYRFDDEIGPAEVIYPYGKNMAYDYDRSNRLCRVKKNRSTVIKNIEYHIASEEDINFYPEFGANNMVVRNYVDEDLYNIETNCYDGLGYCRQILKENFVSEDTHIVQPISYDTHFRSDAIEYLPYPISVEMAYRPDAIEEQKGYYVMCHSDSAAFKEMIYEEYPSSKVIAHTREGQRFRGADYHMHTTTYSTNTDSDEVLNLLALDSLKVNGFYPISSLVKTLDTDEDGVKIEQYTNAFNQLILQRRFVSDSLKVDTYFVYDTKDSLQVIVQPMGANILESNCSYAYDDEFVGKYCFLYKRDALGRKISFSTPGGGRKEYVYDSKNRLILESSEELRSLGFWINHSYDSRNRLIKSKMVSSELSADQIRASLLDGAPLYYLIEDQGMALLEKSYYQTVDSLSYGLPKYVKTYLNPKYMSCCGLIRDEIYKEDYFYYDAEGRVTKIDQMYSDGKRIEKSYTWNYADKIKSKSQKHIDPAYNSVTEYTQNYIYDAWGRIKESKEYLDGSLVVDISYIYDHLGNIVEKRISNTRESYTYNLNSQESSHSFKGSNNQELYYQQLSYSFAGKALEINTLSGSENIAYDTMGRLSQSSLYGTYEYDLNSNLTQFEANNGYHQVFTYDGNRELGISYDKDGNQLNDNRWHELYSYDTQGLLIRILPSDGQSEEFSYFYDGDIYSHKTYNRVSSGLLQVNEAIIRGRFEFEQTEAGELIKSITLQHGRIFNEDGEPKYLHYVKDINGNVVLLYNINDASVKEKNTYTNYGTLYDSTPHYQRNSYRFADKRELTQGNYAHFGARVYSKRYMRWLSVDPRAEDYPYLSPYNYCASDPINNYDPDGKRVWPVDSNYKGHTRRHEDNYMKGRIHRGVDINLGSKSDDLGAPVYATHDGIVIKVSTIDDDINSGGNRVLIESFDGSIATYYMHLNDINNLRVGDFVKENSLIGHIGGSGGGSLFGHIPHLHYEYLVNGIHENPINGAELIDPQVEINLRKVNELEPAIIIEERLK